MIRLSFIRNTMLKYFHACQVPVLHAYCLVNSPLPSFRNTFFPPQQTRTRMSFFSLLVTPNRHSISFKSSLSLQQGQTAASLREEIPISTIGQWPFRSMVQSTFLRWQTPFTLSTILHCPVLFHIAFRMVSRVKQKRQGASIPALKNLSISCAVTWDESPGHSCSLPSTHDLLPPLPDEVRSNRDPQLP